MLIHDQHPRKSPTPPPFCHVFHPDHNSPLSLGRNTILTLTVIISFFKK